MSYLVSLEVDARQEAEIEARKRVMCEAKRQQLAAGGNEWINENELDAVLPPVDSARTRNRLAPAPERKDPPVIARSAEPGTNGTAKPGPKQPSQATGGECSWCHHPLHRGMCKERVAARKADLPAPAPEPETKPAEEEAGVEAPRPVVHRPRKTPTPPPDSSPVDPELTAIAAVMAALGPLEGPSRQRAISYVLSRLEADQPGGTS